MSQSPQYYDTSNVDWSKVLNPSQQMQDERAIKSAVTEDLLNMTDAVRQGKKSEEIWETLNLSRATGLPFSTVEDDKDTALTLSYKKALRGDIEGLRKFIDSSPTMLEYVQVRPAAEGAAMVTDKPLWNMEALQRGFFSETAHSFEEGSYQQERMRLLYKDWSGIATPEDLNRIRYLDERVALNQNRREDEGTFDWIHRSSVELLPQLGDMIGNVAYRGSQGLVVGAGTGAAIGATGGAAVGSVVPGPGTAAGGAVGATGGAVTGGLVGLKVGATYGSLEHSFMMGAAEIYGSIKDMKDAHGNTIDPNTARIIAAIGALPMAGLDLLSLGKAVEVIPGVDRFLNKGAVELASKFLKENPGVMGALSEASRKAFIATGTEVVTEGLQEGVVIASEELAKKTGHLAIDPITGREAVGRMAEAGKEAFAAVLPLAVGGGSVRTYANRRLQQSQASADTIQQIHTLATESETLKNAPELAQEFQKRLGENGGASEVYVRPDALQRVFFQSEAGLAAASEMGITAEVLAESIAMDTDIAIPMDKALAHILNNEQVYNELQPDMRTSPDIMTPREAETYATAEEGAPSQMDREGTDFLDSIFSGLDEEIAANERRSNMAAPYVEQLVNSGYTERQAQHLTSIYVTNAEIMADVHGTAPERYLAENFNGFAETTPELFNMTLAEHEDKISRQLSRLPLAERDPLLALVRGRIDGADIKNYDSYGAKELRSKYGLGLFKKKGHGGLPLDWLADEAVRNGLLPEGSGANELLAALQDRQKKVFYQPINEGVNLNAPVLVVNITPQFAGQNPKVLRKRFPAGIKKQVLAAFNSSKGIVNEDTGKKIGMSATDFKEHLKFEDSDTVDGLLQLEAISALPELMRTAKLVESYKNKKANVNIKRMHRFQAALRIGDKDYSVKLTVKEFKDGTLALADDNPIKIYHHRLEKEMSAGNSETLLNESDVNRPSADITEYTLRQLLEDVNDSEGNSFFHNRGENARGAFDRLTRMTYLFKGKKNLSTVIHEAGHYFLENLLEAAQLESAPEWVHESWKTLQQEYGFEGFELSEAIHERFAREFEAYARSGKAPSSRLQSAFRQFSNWLTRLYRNVRSLIGADEIPSDIRNVFDRLLATKEEIESAHRQGSSSVSLSDMEANGLEILPELKDRYARAIVDAQNKAAAAIDTRRMIEQRRMEKQFRTEAEAKIAQEPFYVTEADVRGRGGISWDSVLAIIDEDLAEEIRRKWAAPFTKGLFKDNGSLGFTDVAANFNVDSPQNLAGLLLSMPTRKEAIDADVQRAIAEWNQNFDGSMEYSNAMDAALAVELEALTGQKQLSGMQFRAELDRRMGVKKLAAVDAEYKALKESLRKQESILREVMRDATREAEKTLRTETREAFADGVLAGEMHEGAKRAKEKSRWQERVAELKAQERAKRAALAAAYRTRIEREKLTRQIRKDANSKSVNDAFRQQVLALVAHWRKLGTPGMVPRDIENTPPLADFIKQHESLFGENESLFPTWLVEEGNSVGEKSAGDLTLEQLRDLGRAVKILAHQGRNYNRLLSFDKEVQLTEAAGEMVDSMNRMTGKHYQSEQERATFQGKVLGLLRGAASDVTTMRYVFDAMDGYVNRGGKNAQTGANHKYIVSGLQDAMGREQALIREYSAKLVNALTKLARPDLRKSFVIEGVALPEDIAREWGGMFTHEKVLGIALNMGNEGNLKALMRGYNWSAADLQHITSRLTVEELQTVQELWDIINELYPVLNETHQQLNGVPLSKVEAREVTFQAANGEVTLRGGYFPLVFDQMLSRKAEEQQSVDDLINRNESLLRRPNPKSGMTKERSGGTLPPKLTLGVIRQHVTDTIHYATHAPVLRDVYRITQLPEYRSAFTRAAGLEAYNELTPWLRHIARPEGEQVTTIDRTVEWLSRRGTLFFLAVNMKSAFLQLSSLGNSVVEVGGKPFIKGVCQMMSRPHSTFQEVRAKSAYMENRSRLLDASLREWLDRFSINGAKGVTFMGKHFTLEQVQNAQFALIQGLDAAVAVPTWVAAYDAAVAAGMTEQNSIRRADEAVIRAQGSGGTMDVARVLRKRGFIKLFTPFMSFALNDFNRKKYFVGGFREYMRGGNSAIDFKTFAQHFALEWIVPVVFSTMMIGLGRDGELPDTEDYVWETVGFLTMGIPLVRDAAKLAEKKFTGKGASSSMGGSVGFAGIEYAMSASADAYKYFAEDDEKAGDRMIRELINTMGFVFGIGTPQLWRTMDGSEAYFVDGEGGILAPFLGKPRKDND